MGLNSDCVVQVLSPTMLKTYSPSLPSVNVSYGKIIPILHLGKRSTGRLDDLGNHGKNIRGWISYQTEV